MGWVNEVSTSITQSLGIVSGDAQSIDRLNLTEEGFWHSFVAIILILPIYLFAAGVAVEQVGGEDASPSAIGLTISLVIQWTIWPIVVAVVARQMQWGANYLRYIVAYNWTSVWVMLVLLPPVVLFKLGVTNESITNLFVLATFAATLWMRWFVARHGLKVSGEIAVLLVVADLVLSTGIDALVT